MTAQHPRYRILIALVALWQAAMLFVCVPAAKAGPTTGPTTVTCCDARPHPTTPSEEQEATNCLHCTNGVGQFVDGATPVPGAVLHAFVERVAVGELAAPMPVRVTSDDARRPFAPPDPTLFALRCALVR